MDSQNRIYMDRKKVIVFDESDVDAVMRNPIDRSVLISLTPRSDFRLEQLGCLNWKQAPAASGLEQARWVCRIVHIQDELRRALCDSHGFIPAYRLWAEEWLTRFGFIALRANYCIGESGPWVVRGEHCEWNSYQDRLQVVSAVVRRLLFGGESKAFKSFRPPCDWFFSFLRNQLLKRQAGARKWIVSPTPKSKMGVKETLLSIQENVGHCGLIFPATTIQLIGALTRLLNTKNRLLRIPVWRKVGNSLNMTVIERTLLRLSDPVTRSGLKAAWPLLAQNLESIIELSQDSERVLRHLQPSATISSESNSNATILLFEAARKSKVHRVVLNHNCHVAPSSAVGKKLVEGLAVRRFLNETVDTAYIWSPETMQLCEKIGRSNSTPKLHAVSLYRPSRRRCGNGDHLFRILHAGNFQGWRDYFPFVAQTSHEYVSGIVDLANLVSKIPEVELAIRCRNKDECDAELLKRVLPEADNVFVSDASVPFESALKETDLLICNFSTTVEQARLMGIPVLLWGSVERCAQISGCQEGPTRSRRAMVYAARNVNELKELLTAIVKQCRHIPVNSNEFRSITWPEETPDLEARMRELVQKTESSEHGEKDRLIQRSQVRATK